MQVVPGAAQQMLVVQYWKDVSSDFQLLGEPRNHPGRSAKARQS